MWLQCSLIFFGALAVFSSLIIFMNKKKWFHFIYSLSPMSHQKKPLTPSFGGVGMVISLVVALVVFQLFQRLQLWVALVFICFAFIGFFDDIFSLIRGKNKGLTAKGKFLIQSFISFGLVFLFSYFIRSLSWGLIFWYVFLMVGTSNATNLTDGLDGLLGGLSLLTIFGFLFVFLLQGNRDGIQLCFLFFPIITAFLVFNYYPAKLFMGDTGSLALGALFVSLSMVANAPWILLCFGAVYLMETLSVMIQVLFYKWRGKRIFLMAPLHHHFELMGISEQRVVQLFWGIGLVFILLWWI